MITNTYCYDIEIFKNLFTASFVNTEDEKDVQVFVIGFDIDDQIRLKRFVNSGITLVGYNNHSYDDAILRKIFSYKGEDLNQELYNISGMLVDDNYRADKRVLELRYPRESLYRWKTIDLMKILAFDKLGISLKQVAINLKWNKIQDLPLPVSERVKENQLEMILDYNLNDALITRALYEDIAPIRQLRKELSDIYHIDLSSASDSKVANLILEHIYADELHMDIRSIRQLRTERDNVFLGDCIADFVEFKDPFLKELHTRIFSTHVSAYNNYKYSETVFFANCSFQLGIGGLHTNDAPGIFVSDEDYLIQDLDVASYYPNLIINNKFYPQHLGENFIRVLKKITEERIEAKKTGNKVKADGLKITINSIFGKMGSKDFWLQDAKQMLSTTVSGQLGLLMLIEDLYDNGIQILSANTDGVVCRIPRKLSDKYYEVAKRWEEKTNLILEFTPYKKYIRRDVNSYITIKEDGSTKEKGAFLKSIDLKKGYRMPIVAKALHQYFVNGIPIRDTLLSSKDIMDFCLSQKSGNNFQMELHTVSGIEKLQKTNRYFVSLKGGRLIKRDKNSGHVTGLQVGRLVTILNNYYAGIPFEDYHIDYAFYEKEAMKIIDEIEPKQIKLFDLDDYGRGGLIRRTEIFQPQFDTPQEDFTVEQLNKLGKNQFIKKIESIVKNNKTIKGISPRYIYITSFDVKAMSVEFYCLAKGITKKMQIEKSAYRECAIQTGQLVFCENFIKKDGVFSISEYSIENKFKQEENTELLLQTKGR